MTIKQEIMQPQQGQSWSGLIDSPYTPHDGRWHDRRHHIESCASADELLKVVAGSLFMKIEPDSGLGIDHREVRYVFNVAVLQAMVIATYKRELVQAGKEMMNGNTSVLLPDLMRRYCE